MTEAERKADIFLDLYKEVEEILKNRGMKNGRSSIMMQFISSPEGKPFRDELNVCREIRNILAHCPDIDGQPPLIPTDSTINTLKRVEAYLSAPPLALNYAIKGDSLICARLSDRAIPVMQKMVQLGYSHIPVFEKGLLFGVFSISTVFSKALDSDKEIVTESTLIRDFADYIPIENHVCESFLFASRDITLPEAEALFDNPSGPSRKRTAAVFITHSGSPKERILGMLTPWDVLDANN